MILAVLPAPPPHAAPAAPTRSGPAASPHGQAATVETVTAIGPILAHQGGWDEILMVLGPLAILFVVLMLANKRARKMAEARDAQDQAAPTVDAHADGSPPAPAD